MATPILVAIIVFIASVAVGAYLWRSGRAPAAFAILIGAPVVGALGFAGTAALSSSADAHVVASEPVSAAPAPVSAPAAPASAESAAGPKTTTEVDGWRHAADELRRAKRFGEARDMLRKVVAVAPMDADAWADLGDASAAAAGDDLSAGREAIERALQLDPTHTKALWLKASLELQQRHYAAAQKLWELLLAHLPPDSNDAQIVKANIDEARSLGAQAGGR